MNSAVVDDPGRIVWRLSEMFGTNGLLNKAR
jgi:hypothetical protein